MSKQQILLLSLGGALIIALLHYAAHQYFTGENVVLYVTGVVFASTFIISYIGMKGAK